MDHPKTSLDLASIGRELDRARQSRTSTTINDIETVSEAEESSASVSSSNTSSPLTDAKALPAVREEQPYPTCILCFTRPPSAVLLPCCHLNLCYLCAPLLLLKQCRKAPPIVDPGPTITHRSPFHVALMKASANHPKSRRLSTGGYTAPQEGTRGGELKAEHLTEACESRAESGLEGQRGKDGRISLSTCAEGDEGGGGDAKCLVCRATINGWLRVYTG